MGGIITRLKLANIKIVLWLTRVAGAAIIIAGLAFFVLAVAERSLVPVAMGVVTITFGAVMASIHAPSPDRLEYKLLRIKRKPGVKMP